MVVTDSDGQRDLQTYSPDPMVSVCVGCGQPITDQFILRVAPDLDWHDRCLRCATCSAQLAELATCFLRDGRPYCRADYARAFGTKCGKCGRPFQKSDLIMRARANTYHVACFSCAVCGRTLTPGDEFSLRDNRLLCMSDTEALAQNEVKVKVEDTRREVETPASSAGSEAYSSCESAGDDCGSKSPDIKDGTHKEKKRNTKKEKASRGRTVLNEKQLHTLSTPDALMKEQLVEMTGLSPRVIRVWFQNKRCKENKRQTALKNLQQKQEGQMLHGGTPLVAGSPVRHEPAQAQQALPVEIHSYSWPGEYSGPEQQQSFPPQVRVPDRCAGSDGKDPSLQTELFDGRCMPDTLPLYNSPFHHPPPHQQSGDVTASG